MGNILITGANRGIGLGLSQYYAESGWSVYACCRNPEKASQLNQLANQYPNIHIIQLNVNLPEQIKSLSEKLSQKSIDILINNAGVWEPQNATFGQIESQAWLDVFKTNTIAPLLISQALLSNIQKGQAKIIVNISSNMGSIADNTSGGYYAYRSSKAALNAITKSMAIDLKKEGIIAIALHPGWVKTDMGGVNAQITIKESVIGLSKILEKTDLAFYNGRFFDCEKEVFLNW